MSTCWGNIVLYGDIFKRKGKLYELQFAFMAIFQKMAKIAFSFEAVIGISKYVEFRQLSHELLSRDDWRKGNVPL